MPMLMMDDEHNMMPTDVGWWISHAIIQGCMSDPISDELIQNYKKKIKIFKTNKGHSQEILVETPWKTRRKNMENIKISP